MFSGQLINNAARYAAAEDYLEVLLLNHSGVVHLADEAVTTRQS